jgi:hypothetical protein
MEAIQSVVLKWKEEGANAQMVMLPTGCGKTVVFAGVAATHMGCRVCEHSFLSPCDHATQVHGLFKPDACTRACCCTHSCPKPHHVAAQGVVNILQGRILLLCVVRPCSPCALYVTALRASSHS